MRVIPRWRERERERARDPSVLRLKCATDSPRTSLILRPSCGAGGALLADWLKLNAFIRVRIIAFVPRCGSWQIDGGATHTLPLAHSLIYSSVQFMHPPIHSHWAQLLHGSKNRSFLFFFKKENRSLRSTLNKCRKKGDTLQNVLIRARIIWTLYLLLCTQKKTLITSRWVRAYRSKNETTAVVKT